MYFKCFLNVVIVLVFEVRAEKYLDARVFDNNEQNSMWLKPVDGNSWFWRRYEFDTGVGNREELAISNISKWQDIDLKEKINNWQIVKHKNQNYFVGYEDSMLYLYNFDIKTNRIYRLASVSVVGTIKSFKVISLFDNTDITSERNSINVIVLAEDGRKARYLKWFYMFNQSFVEYWIWQFQKPVGSFEFFSFNNKHKLILLYEPTVYFNEGFSHLEIYNIKFNGHQSQSSLCYELLAPQTSQMKICPLRDDRITITLLTENYIMLYEYKEENTEQCVFKETPNFIINGYNFIMNSVCFESGNIHYLATSGLTAKLFRMRDDQFLYEQRMEKLFHEIGNVNYIQTLPVNTYRDEVVLLTQLKNKTILAFGWQGSDFKVISSMPAKSLHFDLSTATVIPNFGLLSGNTFVKFNVKLIQLERLDESNVEKLFKRKLELENILEDQESVINHTNSLIEKSYLNNLEAQKNFNYSEIEVDNLVVNGTNKFFITLGSQNFTFSEMQSHYDSSVELLSKLETKINEIENKLRYVLEKNSTGINLNDIQIVGDFKVNGTLTVENLKVNYLNEISIAKLDEEYLRHDNIKITGTKSFPTIQFLENKLKIKSINGIPLDQIVFDEIDRNYSEIDFSKITKLQIENNLNFSKIYGVDWKNLIFKNKNSAIPGTSVIEGDINTIYMGMNYLNELKYPRDYVVKSLPESATVLGNKSFDLLTVTDLQGVKTINGIDADEFIILTADQNLTEEITFENLVVYESFQIDGNVTGLTNQDFDPDLTLLNNNVVESNTMITNLYVTGQIYVENIMNGTASWSDLDDLILNDDCNATVTGTKTFLKNVHIEDSLEIKSRIINGHFVSDFITLDTRQVLPNLAKISGKITINEVSYEELKGLEDKWNSNVDYEGSPICMKKPIFFIEAPIVDEFSALHINKNITGSEFSEKLKALSKNVTFDNLKVNQLIVDNLQATIVNSLNVDEMKINRLSKSGYQDITGNITIDYLEVDKLFVKFVNGKSSDELGKMINITSSVYENIFEGNLEVNSLNVTEHLVTSKINGGDLNDVLDMNYIEKIIFRSNESFENIVVEGLVNGLNFSEKANDLVLRNEDNIIIKGSKKFKKLTADYLEVKFINGYLAEDIVCVDKQQILTGPIIVQGSVNVKENFTSTGKVNGVPFDRISGAIHKIDNETYMLMGDFLVDHDVFIKNLTAFGTVQEINIVNFMKNLIRNDEKNIKVTGLKIFKSVKFNSNISVLEELDDLNLKSFYKNAVLIDRPISIKSKIIFEDDILLRANLIVRNNLKTGTIKNVNIENMMENAVYLNRPTYVADPVTFSNIIFNSDIVVESWNGVNMDTLFTLNKDEIIRGKLLLTDASVDKLEIKGLINGESMTEIYENTFKLSTDQNITGSISFLNTVNVNNDFDTNYINEVDVTQIISLDDTDPIVGKFIFDDSITLNANLSVKEYLNGLNISEWQSNAIKVRFPDTQDIFGNWTIHGNVHFKSNVLGSGFINGIDVRKLVYDIKSQQAELNSLVSNKMEGLKSLCKELQRVQRNVENMVYKFRSFEFFKVFEFDQKVVSVHHFEFKNIDYIMVNFETCHLDVFAYTTNNFLLATNATNFGYIKQYLTFNYLDMMFFLTIGKPECGRSSGNLWKLDNYEFKLVLDLGNVTDAEKLGEDAFVVVVDNQVQEWLIQKTYDDQAQPINFTPVKERNAQFFSNENDTLLASRDTIYELLPGNVEFDEYENPFSTNDILSFRVGVDKKEHILYYKSQKNNDYLFIHSNDLSQPKILQTISSHKPSSILVVNFDGFQENLLIFLENKRIIQVYQYMGIEGFKHHSSIKMKVDKLFTFKLRTHPHFVKKNLLAAIHDDKLTILEARTYGEKLDVYGNLVCNQN